MTATFAPSPWAGAAQPARGVPLRFAREFTPGAAAGGVRGWQWLLRRHCSVTPRQLLAIYVSLCAVSLAIGALFYVQGAPFVLGFAGLELLLVGVALWVFARHAGDHETLTLVGRTLQVEQRSGTRVQRTEFSADWLNVEPAAGQGSLVELSGQGRRVRVGRFLRPELRAAFARELRTLLRRAVTAHRIPDSN
jgi:uncharacterized membrane protein